MTVGAPDRPIFSRVIDIGGLKEHEAQFILEATEEQRAAIAARLAVPSINKLRGVFRVRPARGGAAVDLALHAEVERQCVVSLEPMTEHIDETLSMTFDRDYAETAYDEDADDEWREPLEGDEIDLGELLVQHLSLALDPYPRRAGAESQLDEYRTATTASPFGALRDLKKSGR